MIKKILSYGFVEGIAKGINKLTLLILPLILVSVVDYGKIGLLVSVEVMLPLLLMLGLERAVLRFYSKSNDFKNFSKTIFLTILSTHLLFGILLGLSYSMGYRAFFGLNVFPDLILMLIMVYFQSVNLVSLNMMRVDENHNQYFKSRLFMLISKFLLVILFIYIFKSFIGYLVGSIISAVLVWLFFSGKKQKWYYREENFNRGTFLTLFAFSWPFIFHGISANLIGNADKFILQGILSMKEVGIYTLAYSFGSMITFAYTGITIFIEPMIYKEEDDEKREILLNKFVFAGLIFGLVAYIILLLSSVFILPAFYKTDYSEGFRLIPMIAAAYLVIPFYFKANYILVYKKKSLTVAIISVVNALLNIGLNIILIPKYGFHAAVLTTVVCYAFQALIFVFVANNYKINKDFIYSLFLGGIVSTLVILNDTGYVLIPFLAIFTFIFLTERMRGINTIKIRK